jgi:hypothetical protein
VTGPNMMAAGTVAPYRPACEVCGEEDPAMATEMRKVKLMQGGGEIMAVLMPLRPLNMCDSCRGRLVELLQTLRQLDTIDPELLNPQLRAIQGHG